MLLLAALLVACGQSAPALLTSPQQAEPADAQESQPAPPVAQEAAVDPAPAGPVAGGDAEEVDARGIPAGFTADGRAYRGDLAAPVVMEEFSDFQCPFCARFTEQTLPELLANQIAAGEVLLIYYDFPLENIHPQAFAAANAARCAGEQGALAYWEMHDLLYANMDQWSRANPDAAFSSLAGEIGLDQAAFETCVAEMRYREQIEADIDLALSRGVRSTPSFFLNDQPLVGAQPIAAFNEAIAVVGEGETLVREEPQQASPLQPPPAKPEPLDVDLGTYAATLGDPAAPVTIVEFTDYQCPYCQRYAQETLPQLISEKIDAGEVYYVLKDLPLDGIHPNARAAATAARCAGEQDAYWEMHDALFESQQSWGGQEGLPAEIFNDLALNLGLDAQAFAACVNDQAVMQAIQANVDEARRLGADSTPYFFINGLPVFGAQPYELFDFAIARAAEGTLADAYVPPQPDLEDVHAVGDPAAPVTIIEYTDFQCPFCSRHFEQAFSRIKEKYIDSGQVYYIFKDFPLLNIHPQALKAAEAARCAGEQEAYLEMHHKLFAEQAGWSGKGNAVELFKGYAAQLELQSESFEECLDSGRFESAVLADLEEGSRRGINGTPAFIINGHSLSGAQPYPVFEQAIEQFLAEES